jgi:hypothetical protein
MKKTCKKCYDLRNSECTHMDFQRAITGCWCTNEVQKALEQVYKSLDIYEVWHFNETSEDLWKFLKIKLETSNFSYSEEEYRRKAKLLDIDLHKLEYNPE